jgi:hypothetical protein
MIPTLSTFKTAGRALIVAATLGVGLAAAPAMAAPAFSFNFGINNGTPSFGIGVNSPRPHHGGNFNACMSDNQVVRALGHQGYDRVRLTHSDRRQVNATAENGRYRYVLRVNRCDGSVRVVDRSPMHRFGFPSYGGNYHNNHHH